MPTDPQARWQCRFCLAEARSKELVQHHDFCMIDVAKVMAMPTDPPQAPTPALAPLVTMSEEMLAAITAEQCDCGAGLLQREIKALREALASVTRAADQFAAGEISSGKLAEVLGCNDRSLTAEDVEWAKWWQFVFENGEAQPYRTSHELRAHIAQRWEDMETQRRQVAALLRSLREFRLYALSLRGQHEDITQHTVDLLVAEFDRKVLEKMAELGLDGEGTE